MLCSDCEQVLVCVYLSVCVCVAHVCHRAEATSKDCEDDLSPRAMSSITMRVMSVYPTCIRMRVMCFCQTLNPKQMTISPLRLDTTPELNYTIKLSPTPYTLHLTPYTLHPTPYTLHPKQMTIPPLPLDATLELNY